MCPAVPTTIDFMATEAQRPRAARTHRSQQPQRKAQPAIEADSNRYLCGQLFFLFFLFFLVFLIFAVSVCLCALSVPAGRAAACSASSRTSASLCCGAARVLPRGRAP